jgi:murein L,D-transpeptidase YcbB/YkuD
MMKKANVTACVLATLLIFWMVPVLDATTTGIGSEIESILSGPIPEAVREFRDFSLLFDEVTAFYQAREFEPVWLVDGKLTAKAIAVLGTLEISSSHGLRRGDYLAGIMASGLELVGKEPTDIRTLARVDAGLSATTMRYIKDLHQGRFSPQQLELGLNISHRQLDLAVELDRVQAASDPTQVLDGFAPRHAAYNQLRGELAYYRRLATEESWSRLDVTTVVRPGDNYGEADLLRHRLRLTKDLAPDAPDAGPTYDETLVAAVERFQERHALGVDGIMGKNTFEQLNRSWDDRAVQIALGLERWRWIPDQLEENLVAVLVPAFRLRAVTGVESRDQEILQMRVVVGKAYDRFRTPIFKGEISYLDFRPYWNIPQSIVRREIAPHLNEPGYLDKHDYEIVTEFSNQPGGLPATEENLEKVKRGQLLLRQRPGPKNALGEVKFIFPNEYNVYLHSTPAKGLFARARRDFSHGCIRVGDPAGLAEWVLADQAQWDESSIRGAMNEGSPTRVMLSQRIPVYILYSTAVVDWADGRLHFYDDIYGLDDDLAEALGYELAELAISFE